MRNEHGETTARKRGRGRRSALAIALLIASLDGCQAIRPAADDAGATATSEPSGTGDATIPSLADPQRCGSTAECTSTGTGGHCVAAYDGAAEIPVGPAICVPECVDAFDPALFCVDDDACCDLLRCRQDGLCEDVDASDGDTSETATSNPDGDTGPTSSAV